MPPALKGWHRGEHLARHKLGLDLIPSTADFYLRIHADMPEQHSTFYCTRLCFLPVCILDSDSGSGSGFGGDNGGGGGDAGTTHAHGKRERRPWVSILAGRGGEVGYVRYLGENRMRIEAKLWAGDAFHRYLDGEERRAREKEVVEGDGDGESEGGRRSRRRMDADLIAGIGVEVSTRRRNKFAGWITKAEAVVNSPDNGNNDENGNDNAGVVNIELVADEALGNCPKYINIRNLLPFPAASPTVQEDRPFLSDRERMSQDAIDMILEADTVFFGTTYAASDEEDAAGFPSHLGVNHRGGRVGFMRIMPSDGRTVVLPDYSGDRYMTSLGNIEATPLGALTIISFLTGDILYLTGRAKNLYAADARRVMPFQATLTQIYVTGYTLVRNALPARQDPRCNVEPSPYNPPVRMLAEEMTQNSVFFEGAGTTTTTMTGEQQPPTALLKRIVVHSKDIATFEWECEWEDGPPFGVEPGQAVIMDLSPFFGAREYRHMADEKPSMLNDDFVRTWTISSSSSRWSSSRHWRFSTTMREKPGGTVTGALFDLVRSLRLGSEQSSAELDTTAQFNSNSNTEIVIDPNMLSLRVNVVGVSGDFILPPQIVQHAQASSPLPSVASFPLTFPSNSTSNSKKKIRRMYWIAGGIGITPFLAMLSALSKLPPHPPGHPASELKFDIVFTISTREPDVMLSLLSLAVKGNMPPVGLSIHIFTNAPISDFDFATSAAAAAALDAVTTLHSGRLDASFFEDSQRQADFRGVDEGEDDVEVYVCGSEGFEKDVVRFLEGAGGVAASAGIHREGFVY